MFWLGIISTLLEENYSISVSPTELLSLGEYTVDEELLSKIETVSDEVKEMEQYIDVVDNIFNGHGIYKHVRNYFDNPDLGEFETITTSDGKNIQGKFKYKDEDQYVFVITDHVSLLVPEPNSQYGASKTLHEAMEYFSQEYCLKQMCKRLGCVVINVQQQSASSENQEFYKGRTIEKKLEPSLSELADNKKLARDANLVLGLFAPTRYELESYRGYDINKLRDNYRCIIFLKDRLFGCANSYVHTYFNGAINDFKELPIASEMTEEIYIKIREKRY